MNKMFSRTSIDEANRHLLAMHERISYLEKVVQEQNQALLDKDSHLQHRLSQMEKIKNKDIQELREKTADLENTISQKDKEIQSLSAKVITLQKVNQFLPHLKDLVKAMETTSSSNLGQTPDEQGDHITNGDLTEEDTFHLQPMNVSSLAKHYVTNHRSRNFSISEDDSDIETDTKLKPTTANSNIQEESQKQDGMQEKEYYL